MNIPAHLYPFESKRLSIDGIHLAYLDEGSGPPVLMVHGNPSWSIYYRNLVQSLSSRHRCIVPDHIGCGFSDKPGLDQYPYTLERRVADLTRLMKHLDLDEPITLIVHDWGGMIGMSWAVEHPEKIARIVVLNTAAFPLPKTKKLPATLALVRNTWLGSLLVKHGNAFSRGATTMAIKRNPMSKELKQAYMAPYDSPANRIATLRFVQDIPLKPSDPGYDIVANTASKLDQFANTPVLVCWGDQDFVFDHHFLAVWEQTWPHATVHRFPDCGHYVLEDAPDEIGALVSEFLVE